MIGGEFRTMAYEPPMSIRRDCSFGVSLGDEMSLLLLDSISGVGSECAGEGLASWMKNDFHSSNYYDLTLDYLLNTR